MAIVFIDGVRTPHGTLLGSLGDVSAIDLGVTAVDGLLERTGIETADWVCLGNAIQAGLGQVPGRQVVVASSLPDETETTTVNEASGSGLRAIALAADRITAGRAELAIAGGFESMTNAPFVLPDYRKGRKHGDARLVDSMIRDALWDESYDAHMGELTERLVERETIPRERQDRYAAGSHARADRAIKQGQFAAEIVPVETRERVVERDEGPRPESTVESLAELQPAFREDGTITAGNASKLADGAGVVLLADEDAALARGREPKAELVDYELAYQDPQWFNVSVADATERLLDRNDLSAEDIAHFELNEAFAAQMVYVMDRLDIPREKLNPNGGAVAFGHPIGASGGMLATSLVYALSPGEYGVVGMSIGGGGGIAALVRGYDS
ncbi:thiolase family protein [Natronomonas sp. EA1]|uniref:thiolase family protein n=1 Tax=Natronomonas sp. EA1 TaxID=3421655 RepID=UPI003EB9B17D